MKKLDPKADRSSLDSQSVLRWSMAAATGLMLAGCPESSSESTSAGANEKAPSAAAPAGDDAKDKECCMGKNDCKGKGGCAVPEGNDCAGKNECKGKGGCNMHCPK